MLRNIVDVLNIFPGDMSLRGGKITKPVHNSSEIKTKLTNH